MYIKTEEKYVIYPGIWVFFFYFILEFVFFFIITGCDPKNNTEKKKITQHLNLLVFGNI